MTLPRPKPAVIDAPLARSAGLAPGRLAARGSRVAFPRWSAGTGRLRSLASLTQPRAQTGADHPWRRGEIRGVTAAGEQGHRAHARHHLLEEPPRALTPALP